MKIYSMLKNHEITTILFENGDSSYNDNDIIRRSVKSPKTLYYNFY